jgi:hypothetical protein
VEDLLRQRGGAEDAPATILLLGGDVHTAYVAEVDAGPGMRSRVHQLVCSPFRKPLTRKERLLVRAMFSPPARVVGTALSRVAGAGTPRTSWRVTSGPTFHNSVGVIRLEGRSARVEIRRTGVGDDETSLSGLHAVDLTG